MFIEYYIVNKRLDNSNSSFITANVFKENITISIKMSNLEKRLGLFFS